MGLAINGDGTLMKMMTFAMGGLGYFNSVEFRIKIWDKDDDAIVYDNQMDASDSADPATVPGGRSIIIHK